MSDLSAPAPAPAPEPNGTVTAATIGKKTLWHLHPGVRTGDELTLGERSADRVRNGMGSWPFVFGFLISMAVWVLANSVLYIGGHHGAHGFDPYPYILLNLLLSTMAGLQGAILLIAAKRADQVSSETAIHTLNNTTDLKTLIQQNTEITQQIAELTNSLNDHIRTT